jgi:hypothetical protein
MTTIPLLRSNAITQSRVKYTINYRTITVMTRFLCPLLSRRGLQYEGELGFKGERILKILRSHQKFCVVYNQIEAISMNAASQN